MKQIVWIARVAVLFALVPSLNAPAHGGGSHVMGTVTAMDEHTLTVKSGNKTEIKVLFDEKTRFERNGKAVSVKDLSPGARVVVHTKKREGTSPLSAALVKIGAAAASAPAHVDHGKLPGK